MAENLSPADAKLLIAGHHAEIYRYAFRLTGSEADAEDLTQQCFLTALASRKGPRDPSTARAWLFAVLRNAYRKTLRRTRPLSVGVLELDIDALPAAPPRAEELDREQLQSALDAMDPEFKLVLTMFYFEEVSYKEIARLLELPLGTVMSRLSRAKKQLRARLQGNVPQAEPEGIRGPLQPGMRAGGLRKLPSTVVAQKPDPGSTFIPVSSKP